MAKKTDVLMRMQKDSEEKKYKQTKNKSGFSKIRFFLNLDIK